MEHAQRAYNYRHGYCGYSRGYRHTVLGRTCTENRRVLGTVHEYLFDHLNTSVHASAHATSPHCATRPSVRTAAEEVSHTAQHSPALFAARL